MNRILRQATLLLTTFLICFSAPTARATLTSLVSTGSVWKYLDNGSNQGTGWIAPAFNDSAWASGPAELGYGDGAEATVVGYGPDANNKYVTTYFRHRFNVADAAAFTTLSMRAVRDDGIVVYLNGTEVYRNNLPSGTISYTTLATAAIGGTDESAFYPVTLNPASLIEGENVLAVEIHQVNATSTDISFNLELTGERPLMQITLNGPAHGATGVGLSPTMDVSVSHRNSQPMTVTFFGRVAPPVGPDFTLVVLPDTQFYSSSLNGGSPAIFNAQADWIVANTVSRNIVFVTQVGDCVQNGDNGGNDIEWRNATNALYRLENPATTFLTFGIPYGVAVGNHDQSPIGSATGTTRFYNQYFGEAHFSGRPYYGGHYSTNNDDHFELFSASGIHFIAIHFEYDTTMTNGSPELNWADQLLQTYSDRQAIIVSHWIMNSGENGSFSAQGQAIYNRLKVNANLFLMLCGHVSPGEGKRTDVYNSKTVYTVLSDYQNRVNGGNGWLRTMEFSPANSVIRVRTYSPTLAQSETDADSQFDLYYDMQSLLGNPYATIAVNSSVASGTSTAVWQNLAVSTEYEWYVSVSDGVETINSPIWRFRTVDTALPAAPSGLTATASSSSDIILTWTDNSNNEFGFECLQSLDGVNFSSIGSVGADVISVSVTGLQPSTTYYYRVRAFNGSGPSVDSNVASAATAAPPPPPAAPSNVSVVAVSTSQLNVNWVDNADNETGFRIERSTDGLNFAEVSTATANVTVFSDSGLAAAATYYYRVRAFNAGGASDYSNIASGITQPPPAPPAPAALTAAAGNRQITLTWQEASGANRYYVYRAQVSGGPYSLIAYGITGTSYADGITPHTDYFYVVTALNEGGESPYSNEATAAAYALPAAPTAAVVYWFETAALEVSWTDNASDETGYSLERSVDNTIFVVITNLALNTTFHRDEGLADNTTYYYRVRAFNSDGYSAAAEASGTTVALLPNAPGGFSATAISTVQIDLRWTDNANNENGFKIDRSDNGGAFTQIAALGPNSTSYADAGLAPATTYTYRVRAHNPAGDSAFAEATASTPPLPPSAPSALAATTVSSSQIDLTWTDNANNETGFKVERSVSEGAFAEIAVLAADAIAFANTALDPATTYTYRVRAYNAGGHSAYSVAVTAATLSNPPTAPTALTAIAVSPSQINLSWTDNANNESAFEIERKIGVAGEWSLVTTLAADSTAFANSGLAANTAYYYRVRARNSGGYSAYSAEAGATTPVVQTTVTFTSVAAEDGYITESSETSNLGGSVAATTGNNSALRAGDTSQDRQLKTFLSFNTSSLPDGATIVSATLKLRRGTFSGTSPFTTHGACYVDIKGGTGFGDSATLASGDFQAVADATQVATLSNATANGQWSTGALNSTALTFVNKTGKTQFRVYFALDDDDDATNDYLGWYSGENNTAANRPVLELTYY